MSSAAEKHEGTVAIVAVTIGDDTITVDLSDGRTVSAPMAWFARLAQAGRDQLDNFEISPAGYGIHWPDIDEDISIKAFVG